jgi:hypothetical protein
VAPDCTGISPPCYTAVQEAVDAVDDPGDVVQIARGVYTGVQARGPYTQVVHISKTLTLRGGFTPDFGAWDPGLNPTVLDAQRDGHVLVIQGAGSPVVEGLHMVHGDAGAGGGTWGGGVLAAGGSGPSLTVTLSYNHIMSNSAVASTGSGGGMFAAFSNLRLNDNRIEHNQASGVGGGARFEQANVTMENNVVRHNQSDTNGGGIYLAYLTNVSATNTVLADNQAGVAGGAMVASGAYVRMRHTTVTRNRSGDGIGIYVTSGGIHDNIVSTVLMTNSLMISHTVGLTVTPGLVWFTNTAVLDYTLWDGNGVLAGGGGNLTVSNTYTGNPAFAPDGYHLLPTSDAIDRGVDAGVGFDIDRQPRPQRAGPDLGADEVGFGVFLPIVLKSYVP